MPRFALLLLVLLAAACAAPPPPPYAGPVHDASALAATKWRAVLVAGNPTLPVWDNATRRLAAGLSAADAGVPGQVTRLTVRRDGLASGARRGGYDATLAAIRQLRPGQGEGCLVFLTMHGSPAGTLVFQPGGQELAPAALDAALVEGCGDAPTMVVASGCYSGRFAEGAMARANRVVMTAARPDRSSFGCDAGFQLTVFDDCLLRALAAGGAVPAVWASTTGCVQAEEQRRGLAPPSEPMLHLGPAIRDLALPPLRG